MVGKKAVPFICRVY